MQQDTRLDSALQNNVRTLQRSMQILSETKQIGTDTLNELATQGETLNRIEKDVTSVEEHQVEAGDILTSMSGWWTRMTLSFREPFLIKSLQASKLSTFKSKFTNNSSQACNRAFPDPSLDCKESQQSSAPVSLLSEKATEEQHKSYIEGEVLLSQISDSVSDLNSMAIQIGNEIAAHNEKLDNLNSRTGGANTNMKQINKKIRRLT
ncbi:Hypothetical protein HVR_LOCUS519 [uncultured virus]|nr:Hypothetical protein HVR_LOCUS519 [uncultured virus]